MAKAAPAAGVASGQCLCGKIAFEIDTPARWAWHDHSAASRRAHGAAYATYVGSWRKRFRITKGKTVLARYEDAASKTTRSFCGACGTPVAYERARSPHMVNIPRALFSSRTGREPLYHNAIEELQEWAYSGAPLVPLKGFPGWVWQRSKKRSAAATIRSSLPAAISDAISARPSAAESSSGCRALQIRRPAPAQLSHPRCRRDRSTAPSAPRRASDR